MKKVNYIFTAVLLSFISIKTDAQFMEVSSSAGIDHLHYTPFLMGGGAVFFDYNNDGFLDLYVTDATRSDKLYENFGDGTFFEVSNQSNVKKITEEYYTFGVVAGDINNDGCDDLFVSTFKYGDDLRSILMLNNCDGTFTDISESAGINDEISSSGAAFIDYNNDGLLDIYVINYIDVFKFIKDHNDVIVDIDRSCLPNLFYINQGNNKFEELAVDLEVDNIGCGLAILATDYDEDGDQDIYIANDHGEFVVANTLYQNNYPNNSFSDLSVETGLDAALYGMGIAVGDFNENEYDDFYISNVRNNMLLSKSEGMPYHDIAKELDVENGYYENEVSVTSWGTFFFDPDNDMDLDLFVTNGYIRTGYFGFETTLDDKNKFYQNNGDATFSDVSIDYDLDNAQIGRGSIYGDYDRDGDLDFFVVNTNEEYEGHSLLYQNNFPEKNWVQFNLEPTLGSNKNAFGSIIYVFVDGKKMKREMSSGGSHASQHSQTLHFGLGQYTKIDSLVVKWTGGETQIFYDVPSKKIYHLNQDEFELKIEGCMNPESTNYNPNANYNTGCQTTKIKGCTDKNAGNFNANANFNDGSCNYDVVPVLTLDTEYLIKIYPNPLHEIVYLEQVNFNKQNAKSVIIYNSNAQIVFENKNWSSDKLEIQTGSFKHGMYIIKVVNSNNGKIELVEKLLK